MEQGEGAGGSMTATTMLKTIFRVFHEGDPKWEMLPTRNDHVGQLFFMLTAGTRRGELDRFFSPDYTNATITVFYKNYDHETIKGAIERAKEYIATNTTPGRQRALPAGRRAVRHPRRADRGGRLVVPRQRAADLRSSSSCSAS